MLRTAQIEALLGHKRKQATRQRSSGVPNASNKDIPIIEPQT
jgi:hypothetical protein